MMNRVIWCSAVGVVALSSVAFGQRYDFSVNTQTSSMNGTLSATVPANGTFIGNYDEVTNPTGTRTLNWNLFGIRPAPPTNISKTFTGTGSISGNPSTRPGGGYALEVNRATNRVTLSGLATDLLRDARPNFNITVTITYQSFLTASPNYSYPFLVPLPIPLGQSTLTALSMRQVVAVSGDMTAGGTAGTYTFTLEVPVVVTGAMDALGNAVDLPPVPQVVTMSGTVTLNDQTATASLTSQFSQQQEIVQDIPGPENLPFDFPPPLGTGDPAHVLVTATITSLTLSMSGTVSLPASGTRAACPADVDDGSGTGRPDGGVTIDDLLYYLGIYGDGVSAADLDDGSGTGTRDGGVTIDDLLYYLSRYSAGC
jgi:hypothetical protein